MMTRLTLFLLALLLTLSQLSPAMTRAATIPLLGTAGSYAVLAGSTVTNTGATTVRGDLGVSPGSAATGFPPGTVTGTTHANASGNDAAAIMAQGDATTAYNTAAAQSCTADLTGQDLGSKTLAPGVYCFSSSAQLTGQLVLDEQNNPDSVFIFKMGSTLVTSSNSSVIIINGGQPCNSNIFWQVGSSATLGSTTSFIGNILALTSITLNTGAKISGGLYARTGAVTLDGNDVARDTQACASAPANTATTSSTATPSTTVVPAGKTTPAASSTTPVSTATSTISPTRAAALRSSHSKAHFLTKTGRGVHHSVTKHLPHLRHQKKNSTTTHKKIVTYRYQRLPTTGRFATSPRTSHRTIPPVEARLTISRLGIHWAPIWSRNFQRGSAGASLFDIVSAYGVTRFRSSADLGQPGLTLISGHDDMGGSILRRLSDMQRGDVIQTWRGSHIFRYIVTSVSVVGPADVRLLNLPRTKPTLAVVSCTPYNVDTQRIIVIATML